MALRPYTVRRARLEMVPLIDMFFLLLVFFIFGVFFMRQQEGLLVDLPAAASAAPTDEPAVTISVQPGSAIFVGDRAVALPELAGVLREARRDRAGALAVINADQAVAHGSVIEVLDAVRQAGYTRASFETRRPVR